MHAFRGRQLRQVPGTVAGWLPVLHIHDTVFSGSHNERMPCLWYFLATAKVVLMPTPPTWGDSTPDSCCKEAREILLANGANPHAVGAYPSGYRGRAASQV